MNKFSIDGYTFKDGLCSSVTARVELRQFNHLFAHEALNESNDISLTHIEVMRWLNEADSFEYRSVNRVLKMTTTNYFIYVDVPK